MNLKRMTFIVWIIANKFNIFWIIKSMFCVENVNWNIDVEWLEANFSWVTIEGILTFVIVMFTCLLAFNWWLSYRCFKRSQVIKPKFHLL